MTVRKKFTGLAIKTIKIPPSGREIWSRKSWDKRSGLVKVENEATAAFN